MPRAPAGRLPCRRPRGRYAARVIRAALTISAVTLLAAGGCGGDDGPASRTATEPATRPAVTTPRPVASTPAATAPPPAATVPLPGDRGPADDRRTPPRRRGGGGGAGAPVDGGAEPVRVPATFVARGTTLTPPRVMVPPFLAIELSVASGDGRAHEVVLDAPGAPRLVVPAGRRARTRVRGLRAGEYAVVLDGAPAAVLVVGGDAGP